MRSLPRTRLAGRGLGRSTRGHDDGLEGDGSIAPSSSKHLNTTVDLNCDNGECSHCHHHEEGKKDDLDGMEDASIGEDDMAPQQHRASKEATVPFAPKITTTTPVAAKNTVIEHPCNIPLASTILLDGFIHNVCDGIFLGTAFLLCSKSIAWTLTATTIYHVF